MTQFLLKAEKKIKKLFLSTIKTHTSFSGRIGNGLKMIINWNDPADRAFYLKEFDNTILALIKRHVKNGDVTIDCGAQKGYVSLHLAQAVGATGKVYAFEPDWRSSALLRENIKINKMDNILIRELALGDKEENTEFFLSSQLGWSTRYPNEAASKTITQAVVVQVKTLDKIFAEESVALRKKQLSLIKIDCEGSEERVLRGMEVTLKKNSPLIWMEINKRSLSKAGTSKEAIVSLLSSFGYQVAIPQIKYTRFGRARFFATLSQKLPDEELFDIIAAKKETLATVSCF